MNYDEHDRRLLPRYESARGEALLGRNSPSGFQAIPATLDNVSAGGAAVIVADRIPAGEPVWIRLTSDDPEEWTRAVVVGHDEAEPGRFRFHLRFLDLCSYELFRAAIVAAPRETSAPPRPAPPAPPRRERPPAPSPSPTREDPSTPPPARENRPHVPLRPESEGAGAASQPAPREDVRGLFTRPRRLGRGS